MSEPADSGVFRLHVRPMAVDDPGKNLMPPDRASGQARGRQSRPMILVVREPVVHLRALQSWEAATHLIHSGTVEDQADKVVNADSGAVHARVSPRTSGQRSMYQCDAEVVSIYLPRIFFIVAKHKLAHRAWRELLGECDGRAESSGDHQLIA